MNRLRALARLGFTLFLAMALTPIAPWAAEAGELSDEAKAAVASVGGPFTSEEFDRFLVDLPSIPELTAMGAEAAEDGAVEGVDDNANKDILPDELLGRIRDLGWNEERFLYIYSHAVSVLSLDQMNAAMGQMQAQMASMPEEQRQAMEQMMNQMGGQDGAQNPQLQALRDELDSEIPASEQAVVMSRIGKLRTALGIPEGM
jgi:hypothetical protein